MTATPSRRSSPPARPWRTTVFTATSTSGPTGRSSPPTATWRSTTSPGAAAKILARYSNDTWGEMRTKWQFTVADDGKISRFETGQA
ncbi:hypothetical protein SALBM311S_00526 [Streptomyces alboniger]